MVSSHTTRKSYIRTLGLDVTQVRVDVVLEQRTSGLVVELEQNRAGHLSNLTLDDQEQTADVDAVEGGGVTQSGLVTEQDSTFARESNNRVYTVGVKLVTLGLGGVVSKLNNVTDLTAGKTSGREPRLSVDRSVNQQTGDIAVQRQVTVYVVVTVVGVLVARVDTA